MLLFSSVQFRSNNTRPLLLSIHPILFASPWPHPLIRPTPPFPRTRARAARCAAGLVEARPPERLPVDFKVVRPRGEDRLALERAERERVLP